MGHSCYSGFSHTATRVLLYFSLDVVPEEDLFIQFLAPKLKSLYKSVSEVIDHHLDYYRIEKKDQYGVCQHVKKRY